MRAGASAVMFAISALFALPASADPGPSTPPPNVHDLDAIDRSAKTAYESGNYAFCKTPPSPLGARGLRLCDLADEIDGCEGLQKACGSIPPPKQTSWLEHLAKAAGPIATVLLYVLVGAIVVAIAIPVVRALVKRRRENRLVRTKPSPDRHHAIVDAPVRTAEIADAEVALRLADDHRARGELDRALGLYLHASLSALDRRGAIRVARHRTNGEYVRSCVESVSRTPLREIVREVDAVQFGGAAPTDDAVQRVSARAKAIVRTAAVVLGILTLLGGCAAPPPGSDPAGDELPIEVLRRNGFRVGKLESSLATMPIPDVDEGAPVVIVDVERVALEDETQAHLMRWVEAGGVLVLFGHVEGWPIEIRPALDSATTRDLVVRTSDPNGGLEDVEAEHDDQTGMPIHVTGARAARRDAFAWTDATRVASLGSATYAAKRYVGKGIVLGIANDDLFTNLGARAKRNAAGLVTLVRSAAHDLRRRVIPRHGDDGLSSLNDVRVAHMEDGVPPPANPFAALLAAGLGKGAWHALVASILLFLAYGIRHARPRPITRGLETRRAFAEHVAATGAFYGRAHAHTHALAVYGRFLDARLRESMPRGDRGDRGDPAALLAVWSRSRGRPGVDPKRAAELFARAMQAKSEDTPRGDELAVIEELRQML
jgi:hypothetical protein